MSSRRTSLLVVLSALCSTHPAIGTPPTGQVVRSGVGMSAAACRARGLPSPCGVACSVSPRFCKACCAAVATFSTLSPADGGALPFAPANTDKPLLPGGSGGPANVSGAPASPVSEALDADLLAANISKAARCLAPCVSFTAKQVRDVLEDPAKNEANLNSMVDQLGKVLSTFDWATVLRAGNARPSSISLLCERGDLVC